MNPHDISDKQTNLFNEKVKANDSLKEFVSLAKEEIKLLKCDVYSANIFPISIDRVVQRYIFQNAYIFW